MQNYKYAPDLKIGDLIITSGYNNRLEAGIFIGNGRNTVQYYGLKRLITTQEKYNQMPTVDYVKDDNCRIAKISPNVLNQEDREYYEKAIKILKIKNTEE